MCLSTPAEAVAVLLQAEFQDAGVRLELACEPETPAVFGVRSQLQQVLLNLVYNALAATPAGEKVAIRVSPDFKGEQEMVCLLVEDSGTGIDEENLERIFDPFFTTKDLDQGTGLALMITDRIVHDHDGSIEARSRPGEGSCFWVRLPVKPPMGQGC